MAPPSIIPDGPWLPVEIDGGIAEGMVSLKKLNNDNYFYSDKLNSFVNRKSGEKYMLGKKLVVEIDRIDLHKKELDKKEWNQC